MNMSTEDKSILEYSTEVTKQQMQSARDLLVKAGIRLPTMDQVVRLTEVIATNYAAHVAESTSQSRKH